MASLRLFHPLKNLYFIFLGYGQVRYAKIIKPKVRRVMTAKLLRHLKCFNYSTGGPSSRGQSSGCEILINKLFDADTVTQRTIYRDCMGN